MSIITFLFFLLLLAIGGGYVVLVDNPGSVREATVERIAALLWAGTVALFFGTIVLMLTTVWFAVGALWALLADSSALYPSGGTATTLKDWILWPYDLAIYALLGRGSAAWTP